MADGGQQFGSMAAPLMAQRTASLASRFPDASTEEITAALSAVEGHAGQAARLIQQAARARTNSADALGDYSYSTAASSFPPPSPVLPSDRSAAATTATPRTGAGGEWLADQQPSPGSASSAMDPLASALQGRAHRVSAVQSSLGAALAAATGEGGPLHTVPAAQSPAATSSLPSSPPPPQPRPGATGELGAARETRGVGPSHFLAAAEAGDADAQFNLGACYADGIGVAASAATAVDWWHRAAEQEHASALHALGQCYYSGVGTPVDMAAADACIKAAVRLSRLLV